MSSDPRPVAALTPSDSTGVGPDLTARILDEQIVVLDDARVLQLGKKSSCGRLVRSSRSYCRPWSSLTKVILSSVG
jgi:hypothetical protein